MVLQLTLLLPFPQTRKTGSSLGFANDADIDMVNVPAFDDELQRWRADRYGGERQ